MNGLTASEKLGIGPEVRELKFGQSFNSGKGGSFHTIRYDFKPASVDTTKMATLDVNNSQVTISMQNTDGTATVFTGPRKPYGKECVLIIDPDTGECVLEKLTHSIQVKKTRQEGASRISKNVPPAPAPVPEIKKHHIVTTGLSSSQNHRTLPDTKSSNHDRKSSKNSLPSTSNSLSVTSSNPTQRRPHSPMLSVPNRHSPLNVSPGRLSPSNGSNNGNAFDALLSNHSKQSKQQHLLQQQQQPQHSSSTTAAASLMPSLTNFEDLLMAGSGPSSSASGNSPAALSSSSLTSSSFRGNSSSNSSINSAAVSKHSPHQSVVIPSLPTLATGTSSASAPTTALSESSSGDSSSSISSSDDDESSDEDMEVVPDPEELTEISMPSMPMIPTSLSVSASKTVSPINRSMPSHLLSEDLQLSESGSDSD